MKSFWKYHGLEAVLCLLAASALVINFAEGFYIPDWIRSGWYVSFLFCAVTLLYCYLGSYNKVTMAAFILGFLAIAVVFFLHMRAAGIDIVDTEDSPTAVYIYYICAPLIAGITFLLTRSRIGTAILFLIGIGLNACLTFLEFAVHTWCTVLFVAALLGLFLLRQYRRNALKSSTVAPKFTRFFAVGCLVSALSVGLALLCWFGIVRPLNPPTVDITLLTKYMSYEIFDVVGIAQQYPIPDDLLEDEATDEEQTANEEDEEEDENLTSQPPEEEEGEDTAPLAGNSENNTETLSSVSYEKKMTWLVVLIIVLVVALLVLIPVTRIRLRKRRIKKIMRGSPREQLVGLYRFYLSKFRHLGCPRGRQQTELEYLEQNGGKLERYLGDQLDLEEMTGQYLQTRYGYVYTPEGQCQRDADV
ncbi:MAG: hypothetical protein LUE91_02910, partial [Oscillospiraceae bacterium]|nr:hypothetical protein [Oscillospiraceae bacterium]